MKAKTNPRPTGRPRSFNCEKALDSALQVFWRKGYEGASMSDLTEAMAINRPSLYAAFGDKEALFRKVMDRYAEGPASFVHSALKQPSSRAVVEAMLRGMADLLTCPHNPHGCLFVQSALACGDSGSPIRKELISQRIASETRLRQRLKKAKAQGDLPPAASPTNLARFIVTIIQGMAVQAAGGATRDELQQVIAITLKSWPAPGETHKKQLGTPSLVGD